MPLRPPDGANPVASRREFLRFLVGSPLLRLGTGLAGGGLLGALADREASARDVLALDGDPAIGSSPIDDPGDAVNVFDFRALAEAKLPPGHWAFLSGGVEHEVTLRANRTGFERVQLRPRRLVDTRDVDTSLELLGAKLSSPIVLAPCGSQQAFHPDAELAVARAAKARDHLQILSMGSSTGLEDVVRARGAPIWAQLYAPRFWPATRMLVDGFEEAGCPVCVLTVDISGPNHNRDRLAHFRRGQNPACRSCHGRVDTAIAILAGAARAVGVDPVELVADGIDLDWAFVDRLRDATGMKLVVKGILTHEDAALCVEHGVDAIVVSNHGGRAEDVGLSTIEVLPEIADVVDGRVPILIDSGFRRGTDVFKALALGADAVCIGRPYLWGLASFGQAGVEAVLEILQRELVMTMKAMGTPALDSITRRHVRLAPAA